MDIWTDAHGPPRKKMRKGTKSCTECRRRKIRCTFDSDRPDACTECHLRGSTCIDQEHGSEDLNSTLGLHQAEQRYSLRERVAHLENVVQDLVKRLDQVTATSSPSSNAPVANLSPASIESDRLGPSSNRIENAPVMQLFDNFCVRRRDDSSSNDQFAGVSDTSPKARVVRAELLSLLPPKKDVATIINEGANLWCVWEENFPELGSAFGTVEDPHGSLVAPADIAKALVCLSMSVVQSPSIIDFSKLQVPLDPQEFASRCTEAVDRLVVRDDDFAATLPGIECQMLLSKFHLNEGRLRKSWLVNRRAIEFAHLAGMHLSTRVPQPSDMLFERRLKIWCSLCTSDRSISLILGIPYGVVDNYYLPQVERRLNQTQSAAEQYMLRMSVITGHMIDRNQNPTDMCLETTLRLDQELEDAWKALPNSFLGLELGPGEKREQFYERIPLHFMPKFLRTLLHMPLMLKYPRDPRFSFCHQTAVQSAREGLALYKVLREITHTYLCKMIDFLSFTMGMLLILHLNGYSEESPGHSQEQDEQDWRLVGEVVKILRKASSESGGSVAAESSKILGAIFDSRADKKRWSMTNSCQISVPYFGTITVGAGAFVRPQNAGVPSPLVSCTSSSNHSPDQLYTPPLSDPDGISSTRTDGLPGDSATETTYSYPPLAQPGGARASPFIGLESNAFTGLFDDFGQYMWPNANVDLGLDQGWGLNWFDNSMLPTE
ncbi:uncharacterized protein N7459_007124 [Penicillium hispanicum]|uniref:uncharacterized protein n=1 Tax=Penicillium hispanicum TaxID=1080232 RepID=UPI00253FCC35|nr:uncharacterized protein N7459_007124 [Penicillium hispanicum]KAJ5578160.1 hypothetical protein N7459_007124 [Penicillium hispanicum]